MLKMNSRPVASQQLNFTAPVAEGQKSVPDNIKREQPFIKLPSRDFTASCALGSATQRGSLWWQAATPHVGPSRTGPHAAGTGLRQCQGVARTPRAQLSREQVLAGIISSPIPHSDIVQNINTRHKVK